MIVKYPYNEELRVYSFVNELATGETVSTCSVQILDRDDNTDKTSTMISGIPSVLNGNSILYKLVGGESGHFYDRIFKITTSLGQKLQSNGEVLQVL